jgi:hypothetical protein
MKIDKFTYLTLVFTVALVCAIMNAY